MVYVTHDQVEAMTLANRIVIMRDGHVQQVGAPLEVYDRPVNLFVAGFIGSPEMNLVEGHASGGVFKSGQLQIKLPGEFQNVNEDVVLGVRPEHIALGEGRTLLYLRSVSLSNSARRRSASERSAARVCVS
jgi:ABC-type sugar transport system ATPase subunit